MSTPTAAPTRTTGRTGEAVARAALVLLAVAVAVGAGLFATVRAPLEQLRTAIVTGQVHDVRVAGSLSPLESGYATAFVWWSAGGVDRVTQVRQVSDTGVDTADAGPVDDVVVGSIDAHLRQLQDGGVLRIVHDDSARPVGGSVLGLEVPSWVVGGALLAWMGALLLLVLGPEPARASRWAWFWLLVSPYVPVTTVLFLLLGDPGRGSSRELARPRRLGGGWAFVLLTLAGGFFWAQR